MWFFYCAIYIVRAKNKQMFEENYSLWGENGTSWNTATGADYARIDDPKHGRPGYFTRRSN